MARGNIDNLLAHYPNYSTQLEEKINAAPAAASLFIYRPAGCNPGDESPPFPASAKRLAKVVL